MAGYSIGVTGIIRRRRIHTIMPNRIEQNVTCSLDIIVIDVIIIVNSSNRTLLGYRYKVMTFPFSLKTVIDAAKEVYNSNLNFTWKRRNTWRTSAIIIGT